MATLVRLPGLVPALIGGILGGVIGVLLGNALSQMVAAGDLSDIRTGLVLLLAGLIVGPSAGATIALTLVKHERALATGLLTGPFVALATIGGVIVVGAFSDSAGTFLFVILVLVLGRRAIWLARWFTTR